MNMPSDSPIDEPYIWNRPREGFVLYDPYMAEGQPDDWNRKRCNRTLIAAVYPGTLSGTQR